MGFALYLRAVRSQWLVVAVLVAFGLLVADLVAWQHDPDYRATARVVVTFVPVTGLTPSESTPTLEQRLVKTYAGYASTERVTGPVIRRLNLPYSPGQLRDRLRVSSPLGSTRIDISVTDVDPLRAAMVSTDLAAQLATIADGTTPAPSIAAAPMMTVAARAPIPARPLPFSWLSRLVEGLLAGLCLGVGAATIRYSSAARGQSSAAWLRQRLDRVAGVGRRGTPGGRLVAPGRSPDGSA